MEIKKHPRTNFWCNINGETFNEKGEQTIYNQKGRYINVARYCPLLGRIKNSSLHRYVVETWIGDIPQGMCVNHIDGVKSNNRVDNLEIVTPAENMQHAVRTGLNVAKKGEDSYASNLTNEGVFKIYGLIKEMYSNMEIATITGELFKNVNLLRYGKRWKHLFEEHFTEVIPSMGNHISRDKVAEMMYLSFNTDLSNAEVARRVGFDVSNISKLRCGHIYLEAVKHKEKYFEIYKQLNK